MNAPSSIRARLGRAPQIGHALIRHVVVHPRAIWLAIIFVGATWMGASLLPDDQDRNFRIAGTLIELAGLGLVFVDIARAARTFNKPDPADGVRRWLAGFRGIFLPPVTGTMNATLEGMDLTSAVGTVRIRQSPALIQERVDALERELEELARTTDRRLTSLTSSLSQQEQGLADEAQRWQRAHTELARRVEAHATGGLHLATIGAVLVAVGIAAANLSEELTPLLDLRPQETASAIPLT